MQDGSLRWGAGALIVLLGAFGVYAGTLGHALVWDDHALVDYVAAQYQAEGLRGVLTADFRIVKLSGYYRPVVLFSLWIDGALTDKFFPFYHLTNVLLHTLNSLLLYLLCGLALRSPVPAAAAALLFAFHPVHVEAVAFVSGRTDLWAAFFLLLSAVAWLLHRSRATSSSTLLAAGGAAFLLACLSKEVALLLPPVLLLWDALDGRDREGPFLADWWRRNGAWLAVWTVTVAIVLLMRYTLAGVGLALSGIESGRQDLSTLRSEPEVLAGIWLTYLRLLVYPRPLNAWYTPDHLRLGWTAVAGALSVAGLCLAGTIGCRRKIGGLGLGWIVFFLLPVSGLVPLASAVAAERFLYLPSAGLSLALGWVLVRLGARRRAYTAGLVALAVVLGLFGTESIVRARVWKNDFVLAADIQRTTPNDPKGFYNMGFAFLKKGRFEEAIPPFRKAVELNPGSPEPRIGLGMAYGMIGRTKEEITVYEQLLLADPSYTKAYVNLAAAYLDAGRGKDAVRVCLRAMEKNLDVPEIYFNLARAYESLGQMPEAYRTYQRLLALQPGNTEAREMVRLLGGYIKSPAR